MGNTDLFQLDLCFSVLGSHSSSLLSRNEYWQKLGQWVPWKQDSVLLLPKLVAGNPGFLWLCHFGSFHSPAWLCAGFPSLSKKPPVDVRCDETWWFTLAIEEAQTFFSHHCQICVSFFSPTPGPGRILRPSWHLRSLEFCDCFLLEPYQLLRGACSLFLPVMQILKSS